MVMNKYEESKDTKAIVRMRDKECVMTHAVMPNCDTVILGENIEKIMNWEFITRMAALSFCDVRQHYCFAEQAVGRCKNNAFLADRRIAADPIKMPHGFAPPTIKPA